MRIRKIGAVLLAAGLGTAGASVFAAHDAGAATQTGSVDATCTLDPPLVPATETVITGVIDAPTEVEAGESFSVTVTPNDVFLPETSPIPALDFGPFTYTFAVEGASGGPLVGTAPKQPVTAAQAADLGSVTKTLTAGGVGTISFSFVSSTFDVGTGGAVLTTSTCLPDDEVALATISVVAPPPPGAPNAVADSAEVKPGESVDIAVLDNDVPGEIDGEPLPIIGPEITDAPTEGVAVVNEDGSINYTANADTAATSDVFEYRVCTEFEQLEANFGRARRFGGSELCDTTTVSINIIQPQAVTTTTVGAQATTTTAAGASPTTDQLPVTGSSSTPLAVLGFAVALLGLGLLTAGRRRGAAA